MDNLSYVCKSTPVELLAAMGAKCRLLDEMAPSFSKAEQAGHPNLCGYGKAILEQALSGGVRELVLVNCCDTIRSVYDILLAEGNLNFLYFMDLPHEEAGCSAKRFVPELKKLTAAYAAYSGHAFSMEAFRQSFAAPGRNSGDYIGVCGARCGRAFQRMISGFMPLPVRNLTCVAGRDVRPPGGMTPAETAADDMTLAKTPSDEIASVETVSNGIVPVGTTANGLTPAETTTDGLTLAKTPSDEIASVETAADDMTLAKTTANGMAPDETAADGLTPGQGRDSGGRNRARDPMTSSAATAPAFPPDSASGSGFPGDDLLEAYARALLSQMPCFRMNDVTGRKAIYRDPALKGIIYHTIKFCDYYGFEYAELKKNCDVPLLKLETDYTLQSVGQLSTRLEAFSERLTPHTELRRDEDRSDAHTNSRRDENISDAHTKSRRDGEGRSDAVNESSRNVPSFAFTHTDREKENARFAGLDSGSTSTKAVIIDETGRIISTAILPTGAKVADSARAVLSAALEKAGITKSDLVSTVTTGYGRKAAGEGGSSVTEISCHAKGAFALNPGVRTVIDIGGQDSKVIGMDGSGNVTSFAMNDKCAAGTGRFLEMIARTLNLSPDELSARGLKWKEAISISSTCTVFAESEIISLIADNKDLDDIVHGLNMSVAAKIRALMKRAGASPAYMMTGGVAKNTSVVKAIEETIGAPVITSPYAQFCGAYGAALYAR